MKVLILTAIAIVMIAGSVYAQIDSLNVTMASVFDKTVDRLCDGLGQFAEQSGKSIETAFPYAVKYVGAQRTIKFWGFSWVPVIFVICLLGLFITLKNAEWDYDMNTWARYSLLFVVLGVISLIGTIAWFTDAGIPYFIYQQAPEAATIEYLMGLF